jgi:hypothetical protein
VIGKNRIHNTDVCRAMYASVRQRGAPAVVIHRVSKDVFVGEVRGDKQPYMVGGCCRWAMKWSLAKEHTPLGINYPQKSGIS